MVGMTQLAIDFSVRPGGPAPKSAVTTPSSSSMWPPEVYTRDEVRRLLNGPLGRNERTRTRALMVVMWRAGLRGPCAHGSGGGRHDQAG